MKCSYCGDEILEGARFCPHCGKPVQIVQEEQVSKSTDGETAKSQSKFEFSQATKDKASGGGQPVTLMGIIFSAIAFLTGLVLFSIILSRKLMVAGHDMLVFVPAFVGLASGIFTLRNGIVKKKNSEKIFGSIAISLSGFTIFYGFLAYCVLLG